MQGVAGWPRARTGEEHVDVVLLHQRLERLAHAVVGLEAAPGGVPGVVEVDQQPRGLLPVDLQGKRT